MGFLMQSVVFGVYVINRQVTPVFGMSLNTNQLISRHIWNHDTGFSVNQSVAFLKLPSLSSEKNTQKPILTPPFALFFLGPYKTLTLPAC